MSEGIKPGGEQGANFRAPTADLFGEFVMPERHKGGRALTNQEVDRALGIEEAPRGSMFGHSEQPESGFGRGR